MIRSPSPFRLDPLSHLLHEAPQTAVTLPSAGMVRYLGLPTDWFTPLIAMRLVRSQFDITNGEHGRAAVSFLFSVERRIARGPGAHPLRGQAVAPQEPPYPLIRDLRNQVVRPTVRGQLGHGPDKER